MANMTGLVEFGGVYKRRGRTYVTPQYWDLYLIAVVGIALIIALLAVTVPVVVR